MSLFWLIIAVMYYALGIASFIYVRKQEKKLKQMRGVTSTDTPLGSIDPYETILKYFKKVGLISYIGFAIAGTAALYSIVSERELLRIIIEYFRLLIPALNQKMPIPSKESALFFHILLK